MARFLIFLLAYAYFTPAMAQPACDKRPAIVEHLNGKYQEQTAALGITNNGGLIELFISQHGKTWTLIVTMPNGRTCLMAAGTDWEQIPAQFGEKL